MHVPPLNQTSLMKEVDNLTYQLVGKVDRWGHNKEQVAKLADREIKTQFVVPQLSALHVCR